MEKIKKKLKDIKRFLNRHVNDDFSSSEIRELKVLNEEALTLIDEVEQEDKYTVKVIVPEPNRIDDFIFCSYSCPFKPIVDHCIRGLNKPLTDHIGPQCPRYNKEARNDQSGKR